MNSLCTVAQGVEENVIRTLGRKHIRMGTAIHVLSVGPMDRGSMVHDALLDERNFHLTIATDCHKLWVIPRQESLQVVILHNTLSSFELEDASRFIRRQWPRARILVVSSGESFLEDALYDDRVAPTVTPGVLLTTIEQLM
jgi:hypothetical protein